MAGPAAISVLLLGLAAGASAADLGRLFMTPLERAALEQVRHAPPPPPVTVSVEPSLPAAGDTVEAPAIMTPMTLNGFIARSAGTSTVWINGADSVQGDLSAIGVDARRLRIVSARVRVPLLDSSEVVTLKPGESFDPSSGHISDVYERRDQP